MNQSRLIDHIEKLNVFVEVARAKSFHKAARNMRLSQPSLSQSVRILEDTLKTRLFIRSRKGVELTEAGQKLLQFSERFIGEVDGIEGHLRHPENPMTGSVKVGTFSTLTSYLLPKFLTQMSVKYNQLTLGMTTLKADELLESLLSGRCNFIIGSAEYPRKTVTQFELYTDHFGFFVEKDFLRAYELRGGGRLTEVPLIYVPTAKDGRGKTIEKFLKDAKLPNLQQYDVDNFDSVKSLVNEGLGVGVLPLRLAATSHLLSVSMPGLGRKFGAHKFYCSVLTEDLNDIRISTLVRELSHWCKKI